MADSPNMFRAAARFYDLEENPLLRDDVPFYLEWAERAGGPILDLAGGTGRVAIPLARAGHTVTVLDLSREMLRVLEEKRNRLPREIAARLRNHHADMSDFVLGEKFKLIISAFRSFQALTTRDQQERCLACVRDHLDTGGVFVVNVFRPLRTLDESWVSDETEDWQKDDPATGSRVRRTHIRKSIDPDRQIIEVELCYHITSPRGSERRIVEPLTLSYFYEESFRDLLTRHFRVRQELGYFDGRPIGEGPELIFVCE